MQPSSYGYKIPDDGDFGSLFYPALKYNWNRINSHNHDGINSPLLPVTSFAVAQQNISSGDWASIGDGMYRQLVTMGGAFTWDNRNVSFRKQNTGEILYLEAVKVSVNTYYLYTNDNSLNVTAIYV